MTGHSRSAAAKPGAPEPPPDVRALGQRALEIYGRRAQDALKRDDWAADGAEQKHLGGGATRPGRGQTVAHAAVTAVSR